MESRRVSCGPPVTLRQREILEATEIRFFIPPISRLFRATAMQVLNESLLIVFVNGLLSELHHRSTTKGIPEVNDWGLEGNDGGFMALKDWDPLKEKQKVYTVIPLPVTCDATSLQLIHPQWALLGGNSWETTPKIKSIELPPEEIFELKSSHLLVVVSCERRVKVSNKKHRIDYRRHSLMIPSSSTAKYLAKVFAMIDNVHGLYVGQDSSEDLRNDPRTARELGWRHGTELRVKMYC